MAKLSYVSRKTSGLKIAATCHKDIMKKIAAEAKEAAKNGNSTKDSHLELFLTGREIGDEGLQLVCEALYEAVSSGTLKLDELHLGQNTITAEGLPALGKVLRAAAKQLKDLDLSGNRIKASTEKEYAALQGFFRDLGEVEQLLRLDMSENPLGVGSALEIMLRQYARETPLELRNEHTEGRVQEVEAGSDSISKKSKRERGKGRDSGVGLEETTHIDDGKVCKGLRSIPYIVVSEVKMDDVSALHFSYILQHHYSPRILIKRFPNFKVGTHLAGTLASLERGHHCGIIYLPNSHLSTTGTRLLEEADRFRQTGNGFAIRDEEDYDSEDSEGRRGLNVERLRSKIQGDIINRDGVKYTELWKVCMDMLQFARVLCPTRVDIKLESPVLGPAELVKPETPAVSEPEVSAVSLPVSIPKKTSRSDSMSSSYNDKEFPALSLSRSISNQSRPASARSRASSVATHRPTLPTIVAKAKPITLRLVNKLTPKPVRALLEKGENTPISEPTSKPAQVYEAPTKAASTQTESLRSESLKIEAPKAEIPKPIRPTPQAYLAAHTKAYSTRLYGNLPPQVWRRILALAFDPHSITNADQQHGVLEYGTSRDTLKSGYELRGKRVGTQIWDFLDRVQGLEYVVR